MADDDGILTDFSSQPWRGSAFQSCQRFLVQKRGDQDVGFMVAWLLWLYIVLIWRALVHNRHHAMDSNKLTCLTFFSEMKVHCK